MVGERPDLIAGRYRLMNRIGSGGMGHVWLAWDERLSRAVAVKQLHSPVGLAEADARVAHERAMREARITARLHHPNAVPVFDVVDHEGQPCLVMQYLPSRTLHAVLVERGPLPVREVARIGSEIASALAAAHSADIVHRDVKPGNVLVADDGTARITDFGISRALGDTSLTSTGMVTGTPAYLAPEVARGGASTPASDVFSLGATLYAATEGAPPFGSGDNPMALLHRVASGSFNPPADGPLSPVLLTMLAATPEDRPSMREISAQLADVAAGRPPRGALDDEQDDAHGVRPNRTRVLPTAAMGSSDAQRPTTGRAAPGEDTSGGGDDRAAAAALGAAGAAAAGVGVARAGGAGASAATSSPATSSPATSSPATSSPATSSPATPRTAVNTAGRSGTAGAATGSRTGAAGAAAVAGAPAVAGPDATPPVPQRSPAADPAPAFAPPSSPAARPAAAASPPEGTAYTGTTPSRQGPSGDGAPPARRRRGTLILLGVVLLAAVGVMLWALRPDTQTGDPSARPEVTASSQPETRTTSTAPRPSTSSPAPSPTSSAAEKPVPSTSAAPTPRPTSARPTSTPRSPAPAPSTTAVSRGGVTSGELTRAIRDYYALLPGNTDAGWARLTDRYRSTTAGSRSVYQSFWDSIDSVDVRSATGSAPSSVVATLRYDYADGRRFEEKTAFTLVEQSGVLKIDRSNVISSRQQ